MIACVTNNTVRPKSPKRHPPFFGKQHNSGVSMPWTKTWNPSVMIDASGHVPSEGSKRQIPRVRLRATTGNGDVLASDGLKW